MGTHDSHAGHGDDSAASGPKRIRPYQIFIGFGVFMALFTVTSGIVPQITKWHDHKDVKREPFGGIPGPLQIAFYTLVPIVLAWGAWAFAQRVRNWERGGPDRRATTPKTIVHRLKDFRAGVYMRTLLRDPVAGVMHSMI